MAVSVYCTAWTFYGSVGLAANRGLEFLTIYLGPALIALTWPTMLRKLVRVAKEQRITTISDFIGSRYGKSAALGTLVAVLVVVGMIPYIALQLKAVSVSFRMMIPGDSLLSGFDPTLLVAGTLALFGILFGARNLDFTRQQTGLMTAVAVESIVKLVAFLLVGGWVTWGLFGGFGDIFTAIAASPWSRLLTLDTPPAASYARWAAMLLISMMAVILLPRLGSLVVGTLGCLWARIEAGPFLLVEMGLLSFIAVTQCAPAVLFGLYWRRGNRKGALAGISAGFALWFYTLIVPAVVKDGAVPISLLEAGPLGIGWLRPTALFSLEGLDSISHGVFWSLFVNVAAYLLVSIFTAQDADARLGELLGGKTPRELSLPDLLDLRIRLERMLAASLGAAAARYIIEDRFTISKGDAQELVESFQTMQRSLGKSERLLASVVESVEDCIFTTDVEGRLITLNPAGRRLLGRDAAAGPLTRLDVLDEADRRRVGPAIERAVANGRPWRGAVQGLTRARARLPAHA